MQIETTREDVLIAWLAALAIVIHIAEAALPSPIPGVKPGLANVITITALIRFGWRSAVWISLLRVLAGSLLLGTFLSPTFILSLGGALMALAGLRLAKTIPGSGFGPIGFSLIAAQCHMAGQFGLAYTLFIPHPGLLHLIPVLATTALIFGGVSGIITLRMLEVIPSNDSG